MDELLEQFLIEGRDLIAQAAADFDLLGREGGDARAIDSAFRAIHTLKGSVGIFPMGPAEQVLHAAEDVLGQARKTGSALDRKAIAGLVACLDVVDHWIDQIEREGSVAADAGQVAAAALAGLMGAVVEPAAHSGDAAEWLNLLAAREQEKIDAAVAPLVAFRYVPDPECFFRGDDPMAVVAAVPELVALSILPAEGDWPALDALEPFRCFAVLEGLSSAPINAVQAAFRMMPDQVSLHRVAPAILEAVQSAAAGARVLRIEASRVDALADGLGELIVALNAFAPLADRADGIDRALAASIRAVQANIERVAGDMQRNVTAVRLVPLAPTLRRLPRMAREIAATLDKRIAFSLAGEGLEVDKQIADGLFEPLLHLVRNAIDHGIEAPAERVQRGKPVEGRVTLSASRDGDAILIALSDDGVGIDPSAICAVAISRGLVSQEEAAHLSDAAALRLIFAPGFSTAREITEVSGRGVGMDAVQAAVEKLRGTIDIQSRLGEGTSFRLRLPAHALTTRLLIVEAGGERYGVALDQIVETVRIENSELLPIGDGLACVLRGRTVPVLSLATLLGGTDRPASSARLLVTRSGGERVALRVDGFAERVDTLVRPPSGLLAAVPGVTGSTLLGDGGVLLVLDLPELAT